jgi:hypothetical protein
MSKDCESTVAAARSRFLCIFRVYSADGLAIPDRYLEGYDMLQRVIFFANWTLETW